MYHIRIFFNGRIVNLDWPNQPPPLFTWWVQVPPLFYAYEGSDDELPAPSKRKYQPHPERVAIAYIGVEQENGEPVYCYEA